MKRNLYKDNEIQIWLETVLKLEENKDYFWVSTKEYDLTTNPKGRNSKKSRSQWADAVVLNVFAMDRSKIIKEKPRLESTGEVNFAYIKFAKRKDSEERFGIVHGKSSFHKMYPSDVWFYDFDYLNKKELEEVFKENDLEWHTEEILIIKCEDFKDSHKAYEMEKKLKEMFNTFD